MATLAIDTSDSQCSAAVFQPGKPVAVRAENIGRGHAERLIPMIEEILEEAALGYEGLSRICVVTGPGTFTGLRIGLAVARGLAFALNVPCFGVTGLSALALQAMGENSGECVHAVIKGRGGQVYWQAFCGLGVDGMPLSTGEAENIDADTVAEKIQIRAGTMLGSGAALVAEHFKEGREGTTSFVDAAVLARFIGSNTALKASDFIPEPAYLRAADAVKAKAVFTIEVEK